MEAPRTTRRPPYAVASGVLLGLLFVVVVGVVVAGCEPPDDAAPQVAVDNDNTPSSVPDAAAPAGVDAARRALRTYAGRPTGEFVFARDAYPSADLPAAVPAAQAVWLEERSEVFGVVLGAQARAYPIRWLAFHHVVNDVLGGRPLAVTYCVVCSSGVAYDPVVDGRTLAFGVDGAWRGVATLYDRASGSIWLHLTGACIEGRYARQVLNRLPSGRHTTWGDWRRLHPDTTVMAPVPAILNGPAGLGYSAESQTRSGAPGWPRPMLGTLGPADPRLRSHELIYGIQVHGAARAYPLAALARRPVVWDVVGGEPVTVWFDLTSRSAAAFVPQAAGRSLSFRWTAAAGVLDVQTGSAWTMDGRATRGPLAGATLRPADGVLAEWYGWIAHHPDTTLWDPAAAAVPAPAD